VDFRSAALNLSRLLVDLTFDMDLASARKPVEFKSPFCASHLKTFKIDPRGPGILSRLHLLREGRFDDLSRRMEAHMPTENDIPIVYLFCVVASLAAIAIYRTGPLLDA
jgi:hypothetical protein